MNLAPSGATSAARMKNYFRICRPYGADDLFGFGFYKDVTPTAFGIGAFMLFGYDVQAGSRIKVEM